MLHPWHELSPGPHPPEEVTVVVEIPGRSRNKYELDKASGLIRLDRLLYSSVHYPGDYGFIPRTLSEDGDPLDVVVLMQEPTFPGCQINVRPIGMLRIRDRGELDEKIIGVPTADPLQAGFFDIADVPRHLLRVIEHFFGVYKDLETGQKVEILGWEKSVAAFQEIEAAVQRYADAYGPHAAAPEGAG
ncbi:MAG TPA: inorganic diphosphatase [Longimicrobiales bacterium]|nr:inorganic diphosphatase [Longimicrobiales bacterium]